MGRRNILIIDESDLFREYLKGRLSEFAVDVETAINGLDGVAKLRNVMPDIVILDYNLTRRSCKEVLEEKNRNPNTASIPVILTAQKIDKNRLLELVPYNIKKVFMSPSRWTASSAPSPSSSASASRWTTRPASSRRTSTTTSSSSR
jgi:response regulator RpfG family c-di-GMP phosphodiesterase